MNDLHYIKYLLILAAAMSAIVISQTVGFLMTAIKKRRQMMRYNSCVRDTYTCLGQQTPALILRIQNSYIRAYNALGDSLPGRLFRLRIYPEMDGRITE